MKPKTIQQIIDGQAIRRPMDKSFNSAVLESKRKPPESAWWHMQHRPYKTERKENENKIHEHE